MRLDLRNVIHIPDAKAPFQLQVDLSDLEFYGRKPIVRPVQAQGCVTNHAGALVLEGTARSNWTWSVTAAESPLPGKKWWS